MPIDPTPDALDLFAVRVWMAAINQDRAALLEITDELLADIASFASEVPPC